MVVFSLSRLAADQALSQEVGGQAGCSTALRYSVVIPVRNGGDRVRRIVGELRNGLGNAPHEIILIDNQCTDGCCHGIPSDVLILRTERRLRMSQLMWSGLPHATGDVVVWYPIRPGDVFPALRHLADLAAETGALVRPDAARERMALGGRKEAGQSAQLRRAAVARMLPFSGLVSSVLALRRSVYERIVRYRLLLANGLPLGLACRLLGIPLVTDTETTWMVVPAGSSWDVGTVSSDVVATTARTRWCNEQRGSTRSPSQVRRDRLATPRAPSLARPTISVIITVHNEGEEVRRTVESVRANTESDCEIIVVDDGSTDGCCQGLEAGGIRVIQHSRRIGVAPSRHEGTLAARGDVLAYMDGHQRVSWRCLDRCADLALARNAIVWPDVRNMKRIAATAHGASMRLCPKYGFITSRWHQTAPRGKLSKISTLRAPGYLIPREIYRRVSWIRGLRGWGASELAIALKAFFLEIDILHTCGPTMWHKFKKKFHYSVSHSNLWRNHALIARICFDDRTWFSYWLPHVFQKYMNSEIEQALESDDVIGQHEAFMAAKLRTDREFWRGLLRTNEPPALQG